MRTIRWYNDDLQEYLSLESKVFAGKHIGKALLKAFCGWTTK
jgi:hypothetical protein